jgi:ribosomal protein S18 acetylase RimI-like enzyme
MATELDHSARVLHLHKLYVLPQHHRRGTGSGLLNQAFQAAWDAGCQHVRLNVNKGNHPAIALYRRHGFVVEASVVNDIGGGYVMDDYVMVRPLPVSAFG